MALRLIELRLCLVTYVLISDSRCQAESAFVGGTRLLPLPTYDAPDSQSQACCYFASPSSLDMPQPMYLVNTDVNLCRYDGVEQP